VIRSGVGDSRAGIGNKKRARFIPSAIITDRRGSNVTPVLDPLIKELQSSPQQSSPRSTSCPESVVALLLQYLWVFHTISTICSRAPSSSVRTNTCSIPSPNQGAWKENTSLDIVQRPPTPASRRGLSPIPFLVDTWYLCKEYLSSCHHPCLRPARCLGPSLRSPYFPAWRAPYLSSFPLSIPSSASQPPSSVFKDLQSPQFGVHC